MRFSVYLPPAAPRGARVPVLYLPGRASRCTEETFAIKAGAQRVAAAARPGARHLRHQPARRALPRRRRATGTSGRAPASTSTPPRRRGRAPIAWRATSSRSCRRSSSASFPIATDARGIFGHSMGGHGALVAGAAPSRALSQRLGVRADRRAERRCRGAKRPSARYLGADRARWAELRRRRRSCARTTLPRHAARRPGHERQVPRRAAPARAAAPPPAPRRASRSRCACATATTTATTSSRPSSRSTCATTPPR